MNILFYVNPLTEIQKPSQKKIWVVEWIPRFVNALRDAGENCHVTAVVSSDVRASLDGSAVGRVDEFCILSQSDMLDGYRYDGNLEMRKWQEGDEDTEYSQYMADLLKERLPADYRPDIIVPFCPAPFFSKLFPGVPVLYHEYGCFSRKPYPETFYIDPWGKGLRAFNSRYAELINVIPAPQQDIEALGEYRRRIIGCLRSVPEVASFFEALRGKYRAVFLVPLGYSNFYETDAFSKYTSQFEYLEHILDAVGDDIGVLVTQHPVCKAISDDSLDDLKRLHPNLISDAISSQIEGFSQIALPYVDGVITQASTVGLQAAFLNKYFVSIGAYFAGLADCGSLDGIDAMLERGVKNKDNFFIWNLTHYAIPAKLFSQLAPGHIRMVAGLRGLPAEEALKRWERFPVDVFAAEYLPYADEVAADFHPAHNIAAYETKQQIVMLKERLEQSEHRLADDNRKYMRLLQNYYGLLQSNADLFSSNFFKAFNKIRNLYGAVLPFGTRRRRLAGKMFRAAAAMYRSAKNGFRTDVVTRKKYRVHDPGRGLFRRVPGKRLVAPQCETPLVSIIIPVYNNFIYTYFCVRSIIDNAGDIPYEIIIADDCSSDRTSEIQNHIANIRVCRPAANVGFLKNCNNAAAAARGEYVIFLNNDTVVHPGWLSSLVDTMNSDPKIGIAGSKLVYADGILQEAGGIMWRDGSAWNFGNGDDPDAPAYNYVKECDYTSGASLMIRRSLWNEIGGFDERFVPAYYEDTDLCFEARKHGFRVVYQPRSVVTHFEGRSNGTDTSSGVKKYQVENQKKFAEKWQTVLTGHSVNGCNVFTARDRSAEKQHIFMVDHYIPTFDRDAGGRQMYCYVKILQELGYMVHLLGDNRLHDEPYTGEFQRLGVEVLYGREFGPAKLAEWFMENGRYLDYAFLNRAHIAGDYFPLVRRYPDIKLVYYGHDVGHIRLQREFEISGDETLPPQIAALKSREIALYSSSDVNMCVGDFEQEYIGHAAPGIPVYNMPIFIYDRYIEDCEPFEKRRDLLFVGGFNHRPNKDGIMWFIREILPSVVGRVPDIKLHIVGSNMPDEVKALAGEHVVTDGFVSDEELEKLYRSSRVVVAPLRYGAGVKGKIIEAMYNRSAVVTTSIGAEGIPKEKHPFAIADSPEDFANAVIAAYTDRAVWESYLKNSLETIKTAYSYENAVKLLTEIFSKDRTNA